jgi:hypothetical protein
MSNKPDTVDHAAHDHREIRRGRDHHRTGTRRLLGAITLALSATAGGAPGDARTLVELPAPMRTHMLTNMRDHLAAIENISRLLAAGDYAAAADMAETRLGLSAMQAHGGPHMARHMPAGMRAIGLSMHQAASRFAVAARDAEVNDDLGGAFAGLAGVMAQCVACHEAYRVH